jgi:Tfp pilus assembly protein PilV
MRVNSARGELHRAAGFPAPHAGGFSLLEVMIAVGIFFMVMFSILELNARNLLAARQLQQPQVDVASQAARLSLTNQLEEGRQLGDFELNEDYQCEQEVVEVTTNGLYRVNFWVYQNQEGPSSEPDLSILLFRPGSGVSGVQPRRGRVNR